MNESEEFWTPESGVVPPSARDADVEASGCALLAGMFMFAIGVAVVAWILIR